MAFVGLRGDGARKIALSGGGRESSSGIFCSSHVRNVGFLQLSAESEAFVIIWCHFLGCIWRGCGSRRRV